MEVASSKLRRSLAQNQTIRSAESEMGGPASSHKQIGRNTASKCEEILDFNEKEAAVKFWGHTCKVARYCVRKREEPLGVANVELDRCPRITLVESEWDTLQGDRGVRGDLLPYVDEMYQGSVAPSSSPLLPPGVDEKKQVSSLSLPVGATCPSGRAPLRKSPLILRTITIVGRTMNFMECAVDAAMRKRERNPRSKKTRLSTPDRLESKRECDDREELPPAAGKFPPLDATHSASVADKC